MPKKKTNRAPAGAGGICHRKDGSWQGTMSMGTNPGTGKPTKKYVYGKTQGEVRQKLDALKAEIAAGTYQEPSKMTVAQWLDVWSEEYLVGVKSSTMYSYKTHITNHIKPALGAVNLQKLTTHDVQQFYNRMYRARGLSPNTIKNLHGVLHSAMKQATILGYLKRNPTDNMILPRVEKAEMHTLSESTLHAFLKAIAEHEFCTIYFITLFTGLREGEVLGLTWDCVDFNRGTILIRRQLQKERCKGGQYSLITTKSGKPRKLSPAPAVMDRLRAEQAKQAEWRKQMGNMWSNPNNLCFTDATGRYVAPPSVYKKFKKIAADIGCPELRFHDLRHTYAVNSLRSGDDIKTVQGNLGHHTAAFTLDTYGHLTDDMRRDSADRMQKFIDAHEAKK